MAAGLLDLEMRRRIFALVQSYPGLHIREAARQLETSTALVEYHVAILRDNGLVREERDERYVRLFVTEPRGEGPTPAEREVLQALRARLPLQVALYLLDHDAPVQHKRMVEDLGLGKSTLSFHLRKLEAAGVVRKTSQGLFEPRDRARLLRLLLAYQPTPDLLQEFADTWSSLYGS